MQQSCQRRIFRLAGLAISSGLALVLGSGSCAAPAAPAVPEQPLEVVERQLAPDIFMEIHPGIELLSGLQAHGAWCTPGRPGAGSGAGSAYFDELKDFFQPQAGAAAVSLLDRLDQVQGFNYDAPPAMVLASTGGLAMAAPQGGY